jgi:hypothetical protein
MFLVPVIDDNRDMRDLTRDPLRAVGALLH